MLMSVLWIPVGAIHEIVTKEGSFLERLKASLNHNLDEAEKLKHTPDSVECFLDSAEKISHK